MANTFNQILTSNGQKTGLYTNLLYNIRNQNFNGDEYGHANYLNYVNAAWQSGHHYAEVCTKQNGANWFFQEAGDNLYYIRNQNYNGDEYGNANYLNYKDKAWKNGHHYAEICAKQNGANWFFEATGKDMTYDTNKFLPLFYIRNQNYDGDEYGNVNYLNYKDYERSSGKHYAEIYTKEKGGSWFFEVDKSSYTVQVSVLSMKLAGEQSLDTLLSSTSLGTHTVNNIDGNSALTVTLEFSKSFTSSNSYKFSVDCEQSINTKVQMSEGLIFEKASIDVDVGLKFSEDNSWTKSASKTTTLSLSESVTVDTGKCSKVTGFYKIIKADKVKFTATALVGISGTVIDEKGNVVSGQSVQNTDFITQYITENVKGMTVIDQNYSDTNVKVEITGYMSANMATMDSSTQEVACDVNTANTLHDDL